MSKAPEQRLNRRTHGHEKCGRCGNKSYNVNKKQCSKCGFGRSKKLNGHKKSKN